MADFYATIVKKWTGNVDFDTKIRLIFQKVRDIPYGNIDSRNPKDIYKFNKGTCSGKHELLKRLYVSLGIEVKDFIILHLFNKLPVNYPNNIKELLSKNNIVDPHNFLKIKIKNKWLIIDATWDSSLKKLGFPVNEYWNTETGSLISVALGGVILETKNPIIDKQELLSEFSNDERKNRKKFLNLLTNWLDVERT